MISYDLRTLALVFLLALPLMAEDDPDLRLHEGERLVANLQISPGGLIARTLPAGIVDAVVSGDRLLIYALSVGTCELRLERSGKALESLAVEVTAADEVRRLELRVGEAAALISENIRLSAGDDWMEPCRPEGIAAVERTNVARPDSSIQPDVLVTGLRPGETRFLLRGSTNRGRRRPLFHLVIVKVRAAEPAAPGGISNDGQVGVPPRSNGNSFDDDPSHAEGGCGTTRLNWQGWPESRSGGVVLRSGDSNPVAEPPGGSVGPGLTPVCGTGTLGSQSLRFDKSIRQLPRIHFQKAGSSLDHSGVTRLVGKSLLGAAAASPQN